MAVVALAQGVIVHLLALLAGTVRQKLSQLFFMELLTQ